jgi:hypothetical protein
MNKEEKVNKESKNIKSSKINNLSDNESRKKKIIIKEKDKTSKIIKNFRCIEKISNTNKKN